LDLLWKLRIGRAMDRLQSASLSLIESACPHVDILSFDLELPTTVELSPGFDPLKQRRTNTLASSVWGNANVPQDCQVTPPFQHRQPGSVECNSRPADDAVCEPGREERPLRQIETTTPLQRPFAGDCVVILLIGHFEAAL
jgi:hypothetical protein